MTEKDNVKQVSNGTTLEQTERQPQLAFWHPYQGKGSALLMNYKANRNRVFMELRPENPNFKEGESGNYQFDADNALTIMCNINDVADMLGVVRGLKGGLGGIDKENKYRGMYHQNNVGNTTVHLSPSDKKDGTFVLTISAKRGENAPVRRSITISVVESIAFEEYLKLTLSLMF